MLCLAINFNTVSTNKSYSVSSVNCIQSAFEVKKKKIYAIIYTHAQINLIIRV